MKRFNTITKLIATPALVIALTAGSAMAGPGHHFGSGHQSEVAAQHKHVAAPHSTHTTDHAKSTSSTAAETPTNETTETAASGATSQVGSSMPIHTTDHHVAKQKAHLDQPRTSQEAMPQSEYNPPADISDGLAKFIYSPSEVQFLETLIDQQR
ncbi:hypothetical protein [Ruegeria atlantica]|uniref:hypothetical protein n=1 Tax=Ruegeria atlantica TaxID=81569 RepID=UPI00147D4476|nr:hypothetical protein [Ruegeria atlantica]